MRLNRRSFIKSLGVTGGGGALASCNGAPLEKLSAYLTAPREMVPGVATYYRTVCRACPVGCGLEVKVREGRPVKLEGNPEHPVNRGKLCGRGQAFLQSLYSPFRLRRPLLRKEGRQVEVSWEEALAHVSSELVFPAPFGIISGLEKGPLELLFRALGKFDAGQALFYEPGGPVAWAHVSELLFGVHEVPRVDLTQADFVLSLGADFLDSWLSPVELSRQWAEQHGFAGGRKLQMDYVGPRRNLTATAADRWYKLATEDVGPFALGVLHQLIEVGPGAPDDVFERVRDLAGKLGCKPELSKEHTALAAMVAGRLKRARCGTVLFGGAEVSGEDATAVQATATLINLLTGAVNRSLLHGSRHAYAHLSALAGERQVMDLINSAAAGFTRVLFIHQSNPVYTLPAAFDVARKLEKAPCVVAMAWEESETTEVADVVLPIHHPLESWGACAVSDCTLGLMQPVRAPLFDTHHAGDLLLELARRAGRLLPDARTGRSYRDHVFAYTTHHHGARSSDASVVDSSWEAELRRGGRFEDAGDRLVVSLNLEVELPQVLQAKPNRLALVAPLTAALYDGRSTSQDWLLEVPDSLTQTAWEVPLEIPRAVAARDGIGDGDLVRVKSDAGELIVRAVVVGDDLVEGAVALRFGGGRRFAREQLGENPVTRLLEAKTDIASGQLALGSTRVAITKAGSDALVSVSGGSDSKGRSLALAVGLADARRGRFPQLTRHGEKSFDELVAPEHHTTEKKPVVPVLSILPMPEQVAPHGSPMVPRRAQVPMPHQEQGSKRPHDNVTELPGYAEQRWGMWVDLDRCTGCGSCAVACYAENNVPTVGREEVGRGRELSWIRIERHDFDHGRVQLLPVMCQQCDNAPCETVCPVFASYHTQDGLNGQIYNRCIGTRYCSNNCPYKARRFNYFDYAFKQPENQRLNPDVTVRSRGVMEKCTFCVQRIREQRNLAKASGRELNGADIQPACVQTCPTGAMGFGNHLERASLLAKRSQDPRAYRLLDYMVNTRPGVIYLRQVVTEGLS